jgi:cell division protein ZapA
MSGSERLVRFELLGQEFQFYTATGEREMDEILSLVRREVEGDEGSRRGNMPASKVAVMACLNIALKYVQLKQEYARYRDDSDTRAAQLSEEIRTRLVSE